MERYAVESTVIASVGYDARDGTLEIAFRVGGVYRYRRVPAAIYDGLMAADSHGAYFAQEIRGQYTFRRIR